MSQWTSEYAILRDLSVAQGRVPVAVEGTVGAEDKPPSLNITEETEEEFFKHCSADGDVTIAPDLGLIKKMLDMVRDINVSPDDEDGQNKAMVISKLNPQSVEFIPKNMNTSTPLDQSPKKKEETEKPPKKRQRNIALESILQAIADNKQIAKAEVTPEPMKLLKPNDFITNNNVTEKNEMVELIKPLPIKQSDMTVIDKKVQSETVTEVKDVNIKKEVSPPPTVVVVEKVNGWFKTQNDNPFPKKTPKVLLEATNMFKKKSTTEKVKIVEKNIKSTTSSNSGEYKPSNLANEYYQKYVERSKFKESVKDDIWSRAERKMKEIDEKRRREVTHALTSPSTTSQASENENQSFEETQSTDTYTVINRTSAKINRCLDIISLPQHRHRLTGECVVCEVMTKKPTDLNNEAVDNGDDDIKCDEKTDEGPASEETSVSVSDDEAS